MDRHELPRFTELISALAASFRVEIDEALLLGYSLGLRDLTLQTIEAAVIRAIRDCRYMPAASELRQMCGVLTPQARAVLAWNALRKAIATAGRYASVAFDDQTVNATVRSLGGWQAVCDTPPGDEFEKWLRQRFERVYCQHFEQGFSGELAAPLIGACDASNMAHGYLSHVEQPRRIACGLPPGPHRITQAPSAKPGIVDQAIRRIADGQTLRDRPPDPGRQDEGPGRPGIQGPSGPT